MLQDVQNILARILRDEPFCQQVASKGFANLPGYQFNEEELVYLNEIELDSLFNLRDMCHNERIQRRNGEYGLFISEVSLHLDFDREMRDFVATYKTGSIGKKEDVKQFFDFFLMRLKDNELPAYLTDLLHFSYANISIGWSNYNPPAEAWIEQPDGEDIIKLTHHHSIIDISAACADFLQMSPLSHGEQIKLIVVKQPNVPKSSSFHIIEADSILQTIVRDKTVTISQLMTQFGDEVIKHNLEALNDLVEQGVIHYGAAKHPAALQ